MSTELAKQSWYSTGVASTITNTSSGSPTVLTSVVVPATGGDFFIQLVPDPVHMPNDAYILIKSFIVGAPSQIFAQSYFRIRRNSTIIARYNLQCTDDTSGAVAQMIIPLSSIWCVDSPSPGSVTYSVECYCDTGSGLVTNTLIVQWLCLFVREM